MYILAGRVRFVVGEEETRPALATCSSFRPGWSTWRETIGSEPALDLSVFSPRRDEYAAEEEGR